MSRSAILLCLLREAYEPDLSTTRRQVQNLQNLQLFSRRDEYVENFRLSEELIEQLIDELKPFLKKTVRKGRGLSNRVKVLSALYFFANGSYQKVVGKNIISYVSQASASRCINEVAEALCKPQIVKKYIRFPQNFAERQNVKERFYEKFNIPGIIGCIDGSFVTMVRPAENEEKYYCRKGNHARNVQLITGADLNILHVDASYGGATHDSFIINYSIIKSHLENLAEMEAVYLLGDSGYAQRQYLMTPVLNAEDNSKEANYNRMHATARNTVERANGLLKGRFRCLLVHRVLHYHPDIVAKIVIACCVLHNICNRAGLPAPVLSQEEIESEGQFANSIRMGQSVQDIQSDLMFGRLAREQLTNLLWSAR